MPTALVKTGWVLVTLGAALMFLLAVRYVGLDLEVEAETNAIFRNLYIERPTGLYIHAFSMTLPLVIGPVQFFLRRLTPPIRREKYLPLHRWLGRTYVIGALIGGVSGLYLALFAYGGLVSSLGFGTLAVLTLASTWFAYRRICAKNEASHKEWMTRSYALIFAAVTLRLLLGLYQGAFGIEEEQAYQLVAWTSWIPNLIVAEIINGRRRRRESGQMPQIADAR